MEVQSGALDLILLMLSLVPQKQAACSLQAERQAPEQYEKQAHKIMWVLWHKPNSAGSILGALGLKPC